MNGPNGKRSDAKIEAPDRAVIDIGSNTVRLVVYSGPRRAPNVWLNEKVTARLGRDLAATGKIPKEAEQMALDGLKRFTAIIDDLGVTDVATVATAAARDASNGAKFIAKVCDLGLQPRVLTGLEEATSSAFGVIGAFPSAKGIVADLGGGSLELIAIEDGKCQDGIDHARKSFRKMFPKAEELKDLKWALLKNPENLTVKQHVKLLKVFKKKEYHLLRLTWDARNTLRDIFNSPFTLEEAEPLIEQWIEGVKKFKIRYFFKFINFYQNWKTVILNYFKGRFSTGKVEGTNNKLKLIKRRAFGFLNFDHFRARAMVEFF